MEELIKKIICDLRRSNTKTAKQPFDGDYLSSLIRAANKGNTDVATHIGKRKLWPFLLQEMKAQSPFFSSLNISKKELSQLEALLATKPIRTASGVATVTVLTKPYPCSGECIFCPSDIRMPKSYMHDEPACQRAEMLWFDPYLQVYRRLEVLEEMGHETGKVELIVLGGTWTDYPEQYRLWFVKRLFDALNDFSREEAGAETGSLECNRIEKDYGRGKEKRGSQSCAQELRLVQEKIDQHVISYNEAYRLQHESNINAHATLEIATWDELDSVQKANENAHSRCVGLVFETRPDKVNPKTLADLRRLGATKLQLGIQSTRNSILLQNARQISTKKIQEAFALTRLFGFKIHAHAMLNLLGATLEGDRKDFKELIENDAYKPDEIKLYPCALVAGTPLELEYQNGRWKPYQTDALASLLAEDVLITPPYARISRMIRDIPSTDILAGNKRTNLRQIVEKNAKNRSLETGKRIEEIRFREIHKSDPVSVGMSAVRYKTSVSEERFIQFTTPDNRILGFCRLSLPFQTKACNIRSSTNKLLGAESGHEKFSSDKKAKGSRTLLRETPAKDGAAMIRELHVYGTSVSVGANTSNAQHKGLGKALLREAEMEAGIEGFLKVRVISAIGTREYYRRLGYKDTALYLEKELPL